MVKVIRNDGEIVIHDIPIMQWVAFLVMIIVSGFIVFMLGGFYLSDSSSTTVLFGGLIVLASFGWTAYEFLTTATTTTIINRPKKTLTVQKKGLLKTDFQSYRFDEIEGGGLTIKKTYNEGDYTSIELTLKNGEKIDLTSARSTFKFKNRDIVEEANQYLADGAGAARADGDFKLTIFEDE